MEYQLASGVLNFSSFQIIYTCFVFGNVNLSNTANYIKICRRSDPQLGKCIRNSVNSLRPLLAKGIPELGVPSCEPLRIPEVVIDQGTGPISLKSIHQDIRVYGPSKFSIKQIKLDLNNDKIKIKIWLPRLEVICKYTMQGRILLMPISGSGLSKANYTNIDATVTLQAERIEKDKDVYYNITDFYVVFNIGDASIQLDDLFNGDKDLGDAMNIFLNDNWKQVANEIQPVLEDNIAMLFKKLANKIFHKYPINTLLPP